MNDYPSPKRSFVEIVLLTLLLLVLLVALYDVVRVFFGVFTFAVIFAVSFHKTFEWFAKKLNHRRKLAAIIYSVLLVIIVASPFIYFISALAHHVRDILHWITEATTNGIPPLPEWLTNLPYVGDAIASFWKDIQANPKETIELHETQIRPLLHRILHGGAGIIGVGFELILGIIISAIFLVKYEKVLRPVDELLIHLFGPNDGPGLRNITGQAVRGVSIGVIGTAFIAAIISWIGFVIAGVPIPLGLAAIVFFLVLIQLGPVILWIPLLIWMFAEGHTAWAIFILAWGVLVMIIDSILKPVLIAKSGKLPFLVLFIGVIGGMVAWGFTGMFKGAIIMAVFHTVFNKWLERSRHAREAAV